MKPRQVDHGLQITASMNRTAYRKQLKTMPKRHNAQQAPEQPPPEQTASPPEQFREFNFTEVSNATF